MMEKKLDTISFSENERDTINSLIMDAKSGSEEATNELLKKYQNYIFKLVKNIYIYGYETEDLVQLGYMSIVNAIRKYNVDKGNFTIYVINAIKKNYYYLIKKEIKLKNTVSLSTAVADGIDLEDMIGTEDSAEDKIMETFSHDYLIKEVDKLPEKLKDIIYFVYIKDLGNVKQYSIKNNLNYSTAIKRRNHALKILLQKIY